MEVLVSLLMAITIFSISYPIVKDSNNVLKIVLEKRNEDKILDKNFEKMKYEIENAKEIKIFQKTILSYQLTKSFISTSVEKGNMILLYLNELDQYIVYINRKSYLERYVGTLNGNTIVLENDYEKVLENIKSIEFKKQEKLIYLTIEYTNGKNEIINKIDRVINFSY
jgi:hypothetical protein